jgi:hypothetical protein
LAVSRTNYPNTTKGDVGRDGSSPVGLANGNFLIVGEDNSGLFTAAATTPAATAVIFAPDGTIVKDRWKVSDGQMWDAATAWRGGFCILPAGGVLYYYDNDGNLQGTTNLNAASGLIYDTGRFNRGGMCADIRSHYVFLAHYCPGSSPTNVMVSAFDANTRSWITNAIVSEGDAAVFGRSLSEWVNIACDAYNRVCVTYCVKPDANFGQYQVAARIFSFDGTQFTPLTPSFFPFIQHDSDPNSAKQVGFLSKETSVAMTPREILFYAEGLWNGIPNATNPPTTATETHCYTILRHPQPIAAPRPHMTITYGSPNSTISWLADAGLFILQSTATPEVPASWADVSPQPAITRTGYVDPTDMYQMSVPNGTAPKYYRLVRHW